MRSEGNRGRNRAFTLVELLLVISIIVILISVLLVGYRSINYTLKEKGCQNNLAKIGAVLNQYCQQNRGFYPDAERSWGSYFRRYSPPNTVKGQEYWTYLSNVRQLKDMGASDALFTCPFYQAPNPLPALWSTLGTFDTPKGPFKDSIGNYYEVDLTSYMFLFNRGNPSASVNYEVTSNTFQFADGRSSPLSNACKGNTPIVADVLLSGNGLGGGWLHGGGFVTAQGQDPILFFSGPANLQTLDITPGDSPGYNNSACNTLFAGGYVVHSEPGDFQDSTGALNTSTTNPTFGMQFIVPNTWPNSSISGINPGTYNCWFARQPKNN